MARYLQRLCWNSKGWTAPSGRKFGTENSYPGRYGFGHEEWNFNTDDAVDGYVYGHIYRDFESLGHQTSPGPHDFYFWSRPRPSSLALLVGVYQNAVFVPKGERERVTSAFEAKGVLQRRTREIQGLGLPARALSRIGSLKDRLSDFPILRVRKGDIEALPKPVLLNAAFRGPRLPRLTRYYQFAELESGTVRKTVVRARAPALAQGGSDRGPQADSYWRRTEADNRKVIKHEEILRGKLESSLRFRDDPPLLWLESGHTDLVAERNGHRCLMELKTCKHVSPKIAVRAALGQLLYYAYHEESGSPFADGRSPDSMCVVLDESPSSKTRDWLRDLSKRLGIAIDLVWTKEGRFTAAFGGTPFF